MRAPRSLVDINAEFAQFFAVYERVLSPPTPDAQPIGWVTTPCGEFFAYAYDERLRLRHLDGPNAEASGIHADLERMADDEDFARTLDDPWATVADLPRQVARWRRGGRMPSALVTDGTFFQLVAQKPWGASGPTETLVVGDVSLPVYRAPSEGSARKKAPSPRVQSQGPTAPPVASSSSTPHPLSRQPQSIGVPVARTGSLGRGLLDLARALLGAVGNLMLQLLGVAFVLAFFGSPWLIYKGYKKHQLANASWLGWVYPDRTDLADSTFAGEFRTLAACRAASESMLTRMKQRDVIGTYECGCGCHREGGINICELTVDGDDPDP